MTNRLLRATETALSAVLPRLASGDVRDVPTDVRRAANFLAHDRTYTAIDRLRQSEDPEVASRAEAAMFALETDERDDQRWFVLRVLAGERR